MKRTALARGPVTLNRRALTRRAGMARQPATRPRQQPGTADWSQDTRDRVSSRSSSRCEIRLSDCTGAATDLHHRRRRREGDHRPANALHCCRPCHTWAHAHPTIARRHGWIVSAWADPATVPVRVRGRSVLFHADGRAA